MGLFLTLALMWITKQPQFVPGWGDLMENKYVSLSQPNSYMLYIANQTRCVLIAHCLVTSVFSVCCQLKCL